MSPPSDRFDPEAHARALAKLREARRQAHREDAGYLTHHHLESAYNDAGVLSLAKGEYLAGFQKQPDGSLSPIVGPSNRVVFVQMSSQGDIERPATSTIEQKIPSPTEPVALTDIKQLRPVRAKIELPTLFRAYTPGATPKLTGTQTIDDLQDPNRQLHVVVRRIGHELQVILQAASGTQKISRVDVIHPATGVPVRHITQEDPEDPECSLNVGHIAINSTGSLDIVLRVIPNEEPSDYFLLHLLISWHP